MAKASDFSFFEGAIKSSLNDAQRILMDTPLAKNRKAKAGSQSKKRSLLLYDDEPEEEHAELEEYPPPKRRQDKTFGDEEDNDNDDHGGGTQVKKAPSTLAHSSLLLKNRRKALSTVASTEGEGVGFTVTKARAQDTQRFVAKEEHLAERAIKPTVRVDCAGTSPDTAFEAVDDLSMLDIATNRLMRSGAFKADAQTKACEGFAALSVTEKTKLVLKTFKPVLEQLSVYQKCIRCECDFREIDNIGKLTCWYHSGKAVMTAASNLRWSCCTKQMRQEKGNVFVGCLPCDHSIVHFPIEDPVPPSTVIPFVLLPILNPLDVTITARYDAGPGREMESTVKVLRALRRDSEPVQNYRKNILVGYSYGSSNAGELLEVYKPPILAMKPMFRTGDHKVDMPALARFQHT